MPQLIVAYDAEAPACGTAARALVDLHERLAVPATWFLVGRFLTEGGAEWRDLPRLLTSPLFEPASHTFSHALLRPCRNGDPAVPPGYRRRDLLLGRLVVEQACGRPCRGVRPANGYPDGLDGAPVLRGDVRRAGYAYISCQVWGADWVPGPLTLRPRAYANGLLELPAHGWHENVLREGSATLGCPPHSLTTAAAAYAALLAAPAALAAPYVSFIWHPWSLARWDGGPTALVRLVLAAAADLGYTCTTYGAVADSLAGSLVVGEAAAPVGAAGPTGSTSTANPSLVPVSA